MKALITDRFVPKWLPIVKLGGSHQEIDWIPSREIRWIPSCEIGWLPWWEILQ